MPRKRTPTRDVIRNLLLQYLNAHSSRLAIDDPADYVRRGYFDVSMSSGARLQYMGFRSTVAALEQTLGATLSILPPGALDISIDSTSIKMPLSQISVVRTRGWKGEIRRFRVKVKNCKLHVAVENVSRMVVAMTVTDEDVSDPSQFAILLAMVRERGFALRNVYADKAYESEVNALLVETEYGGVPWLDFKDNASPTPGTARWRMFQRYKAKKEANDHSKPRVTVEGCFSTKKRTIGWRALRAKHRVQRHSELLMKCIDYNFVRHVLLHLTGENRLDLPYADDRARAYLASDREQIELLALADATRLAGDGGENGDSEERLDPGPR